jgi:NAD dependent epimerase/dehydratase family enzyme
LLYEITQRANGQTNREVNSMKIFMTGGTGFVGTTLTEKLTQEKHQVTILTRALSENRALPQGATYVEGDPTEKGAWQESVAEHEVIINLAGANLVEALAARKEKQTLLLSTSAIGYYGLQEDEGLNEESPAGDNFLASLAREWEEEALKAEAYGARVALLRFGIILGRNGGALGQMVPLFNLWLGSPLGSGEQWFSWIHEEDLASIYLHLIQEKDITGPINCTAPNPVRNMDLTRALGEVLGKPTFMPAVPGFMIRMVMGEFGSVLLEGQKVLPKRLLDTGFRFKFPKIKKALGDLLG